MMHGLAKRREVRSSADYRLTGMTTHSEVLPCRMQEASLRARLGSTAIAGTLSHLPRAIGGAPGSEHALDVTIVVQAGEA